MINISKIKESKETWNQASGVQVRGGLLGYEDQSTIGKIKVLLCQSTAQSQRAVQSQSTASDWRLCKVLLLTRTYMQYCLRDYSVIL